MKLIILSILLIVCAFLFLYMKRFLVPISETDSQKLERLTEMDMSLPLSKTPILKFQPDWRTHINSHYEVFLKEYESFVSAIGPSSLHKKSVKEVAACDIEDKWHSIILRLFDVDTNYALLFPNTIKVLNETKLVSSIIFSTLAPGAKLEKHRGVSRTIIRYHLGLIVPKNAKDCHITLWDDDGVNSYKYSWEKGGDIVFDDNFPHEVVNNTSESRTVLFLDIKRKFNNEAQQKLSKKIIKEAGELVSKNEIIEINTQASNSIRGLRNL